jgi:hypothetical protein
MEMQRGIRQWQCNNTINLKARSARLHENPYSRPLNHQLNSLMFGKRLMHVLWRNSLSPSRFENRVVNRWVNLPGIQNPFIVRQISENQFFAAGISVRIG